MGESQVKSKNEVTTAYDKMVSKMNSIASQYGSLSPQFVYHAFGQAMQQWSNQPSIQNSRIKAISPLPADISKEELGEYLRTPQTSEIPLRQVSAGLKWTSYPFFKVTKTYQDINTYKSYIIPKYIDETDLNSDKFKRECVLVDKIREQMNIPEIGHLAVGQAMTQGKVFYVLRSNIDKSHNKVNYLTFQQLPTSGDWTQIIGYNNISKYTISFNLMYFMQPGTDYRQFGDLFKPFMSDFNNWVVTPEEERKTFKKDKFVYMTKNNARNESRRDAWMQNGRWFYYVSLPIDRVWTFEIDDTTPIVASPLSGLMQTFAQQADYEAAQLSLVLNPLIKIFTGEIPYYQSNSAKQDDGFRLTLEGRALFEGFWNALMQANRTSGTAFYAAPVENIKSHDFPESANANQISQSFITYGMSQTGLPGIIPITDRPTQGTAEISAKLEARYTQCIYRTLEKIVNNLLDNLNLQYDWKCHIFGDIYSDELTRANAIKQLNLGDISAYFILAALDNVSVLDKIFMNKFIKSSSLLETLSVPPTAFTQSGKTQSKSDTNGAPTKDQTQVEETKIEKQMESVRDE